MRGGSGGGEARGCEGVRLAGKRLSAGRYRFQTLSIAPQFVDVFNARLDAEQKMAMDRRAGLGQTIVDPKAILSSHDPARFPKECEVPRDRRLRQFKRLVQVANTNFLAAGEESQEPEAHRFGERLKQAHRVAQCCEAVALCHRGEKLYGH